ncbi:MAG: hypothetical protein FWD66_08760, partial [Paludibacter sp.]|nr:hypothetical protein [Paludibacter sp.]
MPFIYGKSSDFLNFTDREKESEHLERNFKSLINTTIVSPRRWGKTSLVENVAEKIRTENKDIKVCVLDIFNVRNENEFYEHFAKEVFSLSNNLLLLPIVCNEESNVIAFLTQIFYVKNIKPNSTRLQMNENRKKIFFDFFCKFLKNI